MIKKIKCTIILFFLVFATQTLMSSPIDSLQTLIDVEKNDSVKVTLYLELSKEYLNSEAENLQYINKAFNLAQKIDNPYLIAETSFFKGSVLNFLDEYDSAVVYFEDAIKFFEQLQDTFYLAATWGEMGNMYCFRAIYDDCLDCYLKSLVYIDELDNDMYTGVSLNNIGSVYYLLNDFEKALTYYLDAYKVYIAIPTEYGIALSSNNIGSVYLEYFEDLDSAYKYLKISEENALLIGYDEQLAETSANLAKLYGLQDEFDLAKEYYQKSISLNKSIGNRSGVAYSYISFANLFFNKGLHYQAKYYLDSSIVISNEIGALETEMQAYRWLYKCDSSLNNFELAFLNLQKYKLLDDSIAKVESQEKIASLSAEFDIEKKEKENQMLIANQAKQDLIIQKQKFYNIFTTIALGIFIVLLVFLYNILRQRKRHYKVLVSKNQEIMQQKEEILTQNDVLNLKNKEIKEQRNILQNYQTDIQSSINYAKRIQSVMMSEEKELLDVFSETMLLNIPRDIISGDFYFFKKLKNKSIISVADCTGHSIPGALMSILNMTLFNEVLRGECYLSAAQIFDKMRVLVKTVLKQNSNIKTIHDGMDAALIIYDKQNSQINFAGAYRPFFLIRNGELTIIKADKQPVSAHIQESDFTDHYIEVQKDDVIYIFSDGFVDQISSDMRITYGITKFRKLIKEIYNLPMNIQKEKLIETWTDWKGNIRQTDDIIVLALKI